MEWKVLLSWLCIPLVLIEKSNSTSLTMEVYDQLIQQLDISNFTLERRGALHVIFCDRQPHSDVCMSMSRQAMNRSLLMLNGFPNRIIYNRVPKSASTTVRTLLHQLASKRQFTFYSKEIFVPFLLTSEVQREVIYDLETAKLPVLYERHMYFIDVDAFAKPRPLYINLIRDPLEQTLSAYYYSRQTCMNEGRCYFNTTFANETLQECLSSRSASDCIDASQGTSPMLPFFCGNEPECEQNKTYALFKAIDHVNRYYTVVGVVEELYNFLFVLEHILPRYFRGACLEYMQNGYNRVENMGLERDHRSELDPITLSRLTDALAEEYLFYHFVKQRFHSQLYQVLQAKGGL
jgi:dermatan/chondrotin sulfate uronyl 2-O-sulfotransferase UST